MCSAADVVRQHPSVRCVVGHCGFPYFRDEPTMKIWREGQSCPNEFSKNAHTQYMNNIAIYISDWGRKRAHMFHSFIPDVLVVFFRTSDHVINLFDVNCFYHILKQVECLLMTLSLNFSYSPQGQCLIVHIPLTGFVLCFSPLCLPSCDNDNFQVKCVFCC